MKFPVAPPSLMMGVDFLDLSELDDDDKTRPSNQNDPSRPFPEVAEEELEWLSNIDAFPEVETCGHMLADPGAVFWAHQDHQSPVSVLESNTSSANSGNNSTITSYCGALKIPVSFPSHARSKRRRRRRKVFTELPVEQGWWWNQVNVKKVSPKVASGTAIGRKCLHCLAEETPQWRAGPMGPKTLCNACGVRYKSGRLVPEYRPASSPTFSSKLHSNSHRTIMEKRRQSQMGENRKLEGKSVDYSSTTCGPQVNIKNVNQNLKLEGKSVNYSSTLCGQQINIKSVDQNREGKRAYDSSTPTCGQQVNIKNVDGNLEGKSIDDSSTPGGQQLNINNVDHNLQGRSVDYSSTPCSQQVHSENLKQNLEEKMVDNSYNPTCGPQLKINNVDHSLEGKSVNDSSTTCVQQVNIKYANQENPKPKVGSGTAFSRRCLNCLAEETLQWHGVPMGTLCSDCWMRYKSGQLVPTVSSGATSGRRCQHCLAEISPKCRMGPMGKTLCNACGMRYTLGRLLPRYPLANRPTYSSTLGVQIKNENHEHKEKSVDGSSTCGPQVEIKNMKQNLEGKNLDHSSTCGQQVNIKNLPKKKEKIKNQKNPEPFLPSPAVSCGAGSGSRCQHCLTENTPNWRVGPMENLCDACWLKYKSSQLVAEYHPASSPTDRSGAASGKRCQHCSTKKTPQWRTGHMGMTLCNACGMRYKLGRLVPEYRPAETFSRKLHSNSHKKTTVMKRQSHVGEMMVKKEEPTDIEEDKGGLVML